jgi:hypothetical protein
MAAAGRNGPLAPHMRPFVPRQCVRLLEDNPPSKRMHFLPGLGGYPSRQVDGNGDGDDDSNGDGDGDGNNNNSLTTIS